MPSVKIGNNKGDELMNCRVSAIQIRAVLQASDEAIAAFPTNPFMHNGTKKIHWEHMKLKVVLYRGGQQHLICDHNVYDLAVCSGMSDGAYLDTRYPWELYADNQSATKASITVEVNFPTVLVAEGNDYIQVKLDTEDKCIGRMDSVLPGSVVIANSLYYLGEIESEGAYWASAKDSIVTFEPVYEHSDYTMDVIPKMNIINIENGQGSYNKTIGNNITNIQLLNRNTHLCNPNIANAEECRLVTSVSVASKQRDFDLDYLDLHQMLRDTPNLDAIGSMRHGHQIIYDDSARDLDEVKLTVSYKGSRNKDHKTIIYFENYQTSASMLIDAKRKRKFNTQNQAVKAVQNSDTIIK